VKCTSKTQNDQPCRSFVRTGSEFCYFHDPALGRQRRAAQSKGGRNRSPLLAMPALPSEFDLKDPDNVANLLNLVVNRLVSGQMEAKAGNAVAQVVNLALRVNELREQAEQAAQAKRLREPDFPKSLLKDILGGLLRLHSVEELTDLLMEISNEQSSTATGDLDSTSASQLAHDNASGNISRIG